MSSDGKDKKVLILGGCGFIGRNFVKYLLDNKLVAKITAVDKQIPVTAMMHSLHAASYANKQAVEFIQADLSKDASVEKVFKGKYDYVFNLCGETRFGLSEQDYKVKSFDTAVKCANAAAKSGVKKFVEVSTAQVYESSSSKATEESKIAPWTVQASYRLKAEEELKKIKDLPLVILRPAIVYGPGDLTGLMPRIVCAAVYQKSQKTMNFLWSENLRINVVHVQDVCRALWAAGAELPAGKVYNVADDSDLTQGKFNEFLQSLFNLKTSFLGAIISSLAKGDIEGLASQANGEHIPGWQELCQDHKINTTPLSPMISPELLYNNALYIDGSKIAKDSKLFKQYTGVSLQLIREMVEFAVDQRVFPAVLKKK